MHYLATEKWQPLSQSCRSELDGLHSGRTSLNADLVCPSADFVHKTFYATPTLLALNGFQNPSDPLNTAMQLAFNAPGKAPYEIFVSKPHSARAIGTMLAAMGVSKLHRIETVYPIRERLVHGFDQSLQDALFVDIGAGNGHVVAGLRAAMPDLPGRLVAQDLPAVIGAVLAPPEGVEMQAYDFFTEQPIQCKSQITSRHLVFL